jgi:hypothetical protein
LKKPSSVSSSGVYLTVRNPRPIKRTISSITRNGLLDDDWALGAGGAHPGCCPHPGCCGGIPPGCCPHPGCCGGIPPGCCPHPGCCGMPPPSIAPQFGQNLVPGLTVILH